MIQKPPYSSSAGLRCSGSRWITEEIRYFLKNRSAANLIPVLSKGDPGQVLDGMFGQIEGMPRELRACDCRGSSYRVIREEIPRIASTLIGCEFDELVGRFRRYRQKRMAAIAAVTAVLLVCAAVFFSVNHSRLQKIREENQIRESRELARQSAVCLERHAQFDAIRSAMAALPETEGERPVVAEAVLALQKAVNAYVPGGGENLVQTGEFSVEGLIDDWDCRQTDKGTFLAVQYESDGQYGFSIWETDVDNAYQMTILAAGEDLAAVYVYAVSGEGEDEDESEVEELQFRRLSDGALISRLRPEAAEINMDPEADAYAEVPAAVFSPDEEYLILETDLRHYDDHTADSCSLYKIDVKTKEEILLIKERELYDFCPASDRGQLVLVCGKDCDAEEGAIFLKSIRLSTGEKVWESEAIETAAAGDIRWSYRPEGDYTVADAWEQCGRIALRLDSDENEGEERWVILDTASGDPQIVVNPALGILEEAAGGVEYIDAILAGEYLEYCPSSDRFLIGKGRNVYLAKRYSCGELVQKGKKILQGPGLR